MAIVNNTHYNITYKYDLRKSWRVLRWAGVSHSFVPPTSRAVEDNTGLRDCFARRMLFILDLKPKDESHALHAMISRQDKRCIPFFRASYIPHDVCVSPVGVQECSPR